MKLRKKTLVLVLTLCLLFQMLAGTVNAAGTGDEARYTQKIVSVLYDNSGSMDSDNKYEYAHYAIQMLMSLLSEKDVLVITPMNAPNGVAVTDTSSSVEINLGKKDRKGEIDKALSSSFLANEPKGMTPGASIAVAVEHLVDRGMVKKDDLIGLQKAGDKEYWLVILTDGSFDEQTATRSADDVVEPYITDYSALQTIFLSFGSSAPDLTGCELSQTMPFTPYKAAKSSEIIEVIQKIANQLTGRYTLAPSSYTVSGSRVTIDLNKYEYSLNSISVTAQNCGATLKSAKYNGKSIDILQPCVITANDKLKMKTGYTAVMKGDPYLSGGVLELEFSANVSNFSVLVEPALYIEPYLEYEDGSNWIEADMQYINSHLSEKDQIRVGYRVYEKASGKPIDLAKIFGETQTNVTYANNSYRVGDPIPLVVGNNELGISVSVMDGTYTMYASMLCIIERNPDYYRVEASYNDMLRTDAPKTSITYTVYADNVPVSAAALSTYDWEVVAVAPDGSEYPIKASAGSDGKINATLDASSGAYGMYKVNMRVVSEYGMARTHEAQIKYYPLSIETKVTANETMSLTQHQIEGNTKAITFLLTAEGRSFDFASPLVSYKVEVEGTDVTDFATVDGNVLSYVPQAGAFGNHASTLGEKTVKLTVSCVDFPALTATAEAKVNITNTQFTLEVVSTGNKDVDRFAITDSDAVVYFRAGRDGVALSEEDLRQALENGSVKVKDKGTFSKYFWLPCGKDVTVEVVNGEALVACRITRDWLKPFHTFAAMLISNGDKPITATYMGVEASDAVTFVKSSAFSYVWRILVIILITYLILFVIGFFNGKCRNLPNGTFISIQFMDDDNDPVTIQKKNVNATFTARWLWHFRRLLGFSAIGGKPLWSDQDEVRVFGNIIRMTFVPKRKKAQFVYSKSYKYLSKLPANDVEGVNLEKYLAKFKSKTYSGGNPSVPIVSTGSVKKIFVSDGATFTPLQGDVNTRYFADIDENGQISRVMFFIKRHN